MQVRHRLARVRARVHDGSIARARVPAVACDRCGTSSKLSEERFVFWRRSAVVGQMLARDDEHMKWRLRIDIAYDEEVVILKHNIGGDLPRDDLAEYAIVHAPV